MGTRMGPSYANPFMGYLEERIQREYSDTTPELYTRYIDDVFGITSMPIEHLIKWIDFVQNLHPTIDFTFSISEEEVCFFDINFQIVSNAITTSVHYKPSDSHSYLRYNSFDPKSTRDSIPYSQLLRLRRLTSNDTEFVTVAEEMITFFEARDYPHLYPGKPMNASWVSLKSNSSYAINQHHILNSYIHFFD